MSYPGGATSGLEVPVRPAAIEKGNTFGGKTAKAPSSGRGDPLAATAEDARSRGGREGDGETNTPPPGGLVCRLATTSTG
jgi:hypothetical protein